MCRDEGAAEGSTAASAGKGLRCSSRAGSHAQSSAGSKHRVAAATTAPSMRRFTRRTARSTSRSDTAPTQSLHASPEVALEAVAVNPRARATRVPDVASRPTRNAEAKTEPRVGAPEHRSWSDRSDVQPVADPVATAREHRRAASRETCAIAARAPTNLAGGKGGRAPENRDRSSAFSASVAEENHARNPGPEP